MKLNESTTQSMNSTSDLLSFKSQQMPQTVQQITRRSSISSTTQKRNLNNNDSRRRTLGAINSDFLTQSTSSSFSIPLLLTTMNTFFQTVHTMEEEIMLPSRLKDMPVEEFVFDNPVQPDNWYEIYTFIRDMRNQLQCKHPFAEDEDNDNNNNSKKQEKEYFNDDEGIIVLNPDSSASSTISSDELEQSLTSSISTSYAMLKDQLKYHYYGLFQTLDNLTSISNRVTEKYREESLF